MNEGGRARCSATNHAPQQSLLRRRLRPPRRPCARRCCRCHSAAKLATIRRVFLLSYHFSFSPVGLQDAELLADIARLKATRAALPPAPEQPAWLELTERSLVALFFVILAFGAWLIAGVVQQSASGGAETSVSDAWLAVWPTLIQPALGVFMAAALVSGVPRWLRTRGEKAED